MDAPVTRESTAVDHLAEEWLDQLIEHDPELRVHLGRPGDQSAYADRSPDGHAAAADAARVMLTRVRATEPTDGVDRVTLSELDRTLGLQIEVHEAGLWQRDLNVIASPLQAVREVFDLMGTSSPQDWSDISQRLERVPEALTGYIESLRAGIAAGNVPAVRQVRESVGQAEKLARPDGFFNQLAKQAQGLPAMQMIDIENGSQRAAEAYGELARFLDRELSPVAPQADGVGRELYGLCSREFVGVEIDLDETYAWGVDELARMVDEQEQIAKSLGSSSVRGAIAALEADPARRLQGTEALRAWMQRTSDQAVEELGRTHFDIPEPMRRLECMIAPTDEGGIYYTPPSDDFSRPGRMWWSVPEGVTEFDAWRELTTVYHEGVPGHHLQCGIAVHNSAELNGWRRMNWNSGHGEGWALYAERLMADLGYLDDPADRLGMLDGQRMRAARVVLDIGVHLGLPKPDGSGTWTGQDAYPFLNQHVAMNDGFIRFEANRYLGWPGQAPSYKVGQRLWEQLRDDWVATNGSDLKPFHRQALAVGGVGLGTLREILL